MNRTEVVTLIISIEFELWAKIFASSRQRAKKQNEFVCVCIMWLKIVNENDARLRIEL